MSFEPGEQIWYEGNPSYDSFGSGQVEFVKYTRDDPNASTSVVKFLDGKIAAVYTQYLSPLKKVEDSNILEIANSLVHGDRGEDYGHPYDDFKRTAKMWSAIFNCPVYPEQVALAMICVKISRLTNEPTKRDSVIDIAGYAETYDMVMQWYKEHEGDF